MKLKKPRNLFASFLKHAFSLVELMVTLIVISCIISALVPVITKKLKSQGITVDSGGGSANLEFNQDCSAFGVDCALCFEDRCSLCTKVCESYEYVSTADCVCQNCTDKGENCIGCTSKACNKCDTGYGLTSIKACEKCENNQYSDGTIPCTLCPENYYCNGTASVACPTDSYAPAGSISCIACSDTYSNCATCNSSECLTCKKGYKLKDTACILASGSQTFTTAGEHSFTVPEGVEELTVTLVSGGAGGGGGNIVAMTETFVVSGSGNSANDALNLLHVASSGLFTWNIPTAIQGTDVLVSACGGGGGGGSNTAGGRGGIINNVSIPIPNQTTIGIIVGGGGGGQMKNGSCAYGGGGGNVWSNSATTRYTSCGASGSWGAGGMWHSTQGLGGYDPIFNEHGVGGGAGGSGAGAGGKGSRVGGGGGGGDTDGNNYRGGGGGGATLFKNNNLALVQAYVAPGGGGGSTRGTGGYTGGGGGGGGGVGGGAGASSPKSQSSGTVSAGSAGTGSGTNVFGSSYCAGGTAGTNGKNGAMRIAYLNKPNGGTGGGAGHMVINQEIDVIPNDTLTIIVGRGGKGGVAGAGNTSTMQLTSVSTNGESANDEMLSKILNSNGIVLVTSAPNVQAMGATGGNVNGTTVGERGFISDGVSVVDLGSIDGYSNNSGGAANGLVGGAGAQTYLGSNSVLHCVARSGGADGVAAENPSNQEYGGCGGAGGGAGANGGDGAQGYVKISWGE